MDRAWQLPAAARLMGWLWLGVLGAGTMGTMALLRVPRILWTMVGAALMLGAAGYALQGAPGLPARDAGPDGLVTPEDPAIADLRDRMFGRFTGDGAWAVAADAMARSGDRHAAVQATLAGIRHFPRSAELWTMLGTTYVAHDGGQLSPSALFAFEQAMRVAPRHPGPPFLAGVAAARSGNLALARAFWLRALRLSPPGVSYRQDIAIRLAMIDRLLAIQRGMGR